MDHGVEQGGHVHHHHHCHNQGDSGDDREPADGLQQHGVLDWVSEEGFAGPDVREDVIILAKETNTDYGDNGEQHPSVPKEEDLEKLEESKTLP